MYNGQCISISESTLSNYETNNFSQEGVTSLPSPSAAPPIRYLPSTCCVFTKWDSMTPSEQARRNANDYSNPNSNPFRPQQHHNKGYVSPEVNRRHHHQQLPPSFHSTRTRSPRETLISSFSRNFQEVDEILGPNLAASRKKINPNLTNSSRNSTISRDKTDRSNSPASGRGFPGVDPMTPDITGMSGSSSGKISSVEGRCELPPEPISLSSPTSPTTTTSSNEASMSPTPTVNLNFPVGAPSRTPFTESPSPSTPKGHSLVQQSQHTTGCADKILAWVNHVTDVLFVIGFCIIVFLKGCFLAILRYEIKEMIQKIRLLNGDESLRSAAMNELIGLTSMYNSGSQEDVEGHELVACVGPHDSASTETVMNEKKPHVHNPSSRSNSVAVSGNSTGSEPSAPNVKRYKYPPFGNHLNSNNMVYRLQRQQSIQKQHEVDEDFDSSSGLLSQPLTALVTESKLIKSIVGERGPRVNSLPVPIPYPRNGNNNTSIEMTTTTALVNSTSITAGATPLATATTSKIL